MNALRNYISFLLEKFGKVSLIIAQITESGRLTRTLTVHLAPNAATQAGKETKIHEQ
jgi:hypothetical protein